MSFDFTVSGPMGARTVSIEKPLLSLEDAERIVLRTSANKPVALVDSEWPQHLASNIHKRLSRRDGEKKGRVLVIWLDRKGRPVKPLAVSAWHVHQGNWPLAIFDAGVANAVSDPRRARFFCRVFVAALGELAGHPKFKDTQVDRPDDRVLWRVDDAAPGPNRPERRALAIEAARRGMADFGAAKIPKADRPAWAKDGFLGRIDVEPVEKADRS